MVSFMSRGSEGSEGSSILDGGRAQVEGPNGALPGIQSAPVGGDGGQAPAPASAVLQKCRALQGEVQAEDDDEDSARDTAEGMTAGNHIIKDEDQA